MAERDEFGAFLIGFIIGGLTGAAVSLLMAPQTGEETREYLRDRAIELREKAADTAQTTYEQVGTTASDFRTRAGDVVDRAKLSAEEIQRRGQVVIEEQRAKLTEKVQHLRKHDEDEAGAAPV